MMIGTSWLAIAASFPLFLCNHHVTAQSPGPDYPNCALASLGGPGGPVGWELFRFHYDPVMPGREDAPNATLSMDVTNLADGSRIVCSMVDLPDTEGTTSVLLDSSKLEENLEASIFCRTIWATPHDEQYLGRDDILRGPDPVVTFETDTRILTINQTWKCRNPEEGSELLTFTGTATGVVDLICGGGRHGERTSCSPPTLYVVNKPPVFFGPAKVVANSPVPPTLADVESISSTHCRSPAEHKWQILYMYYGPPTNIPIAFGSVMRASAHLALRNLADGSRTRCYLGDATDPAIAEANGNDIVLRTNGVNIVTSAPDGPDIIGCWTGWWSSLNGMKESGRLEWRWMPLAEVTFNTRTHVMTVNQTWSCGASGGAGGAGGAGGTGDVGVNGYVSEKLDLKCEKSSYSSSNNVGCEPLDMYWRREAGTVPVLG